jgi:hypothetical protein
LLLDMPLPFSRYRRFLKRTYMFDGAQCFDLVALPRRIRAGIGMPFALR